MLRSFKLIFALSLYSSTICKGFDASWISSDDGQLPLSEKYRTQLRKLCELIRSQKKLPLELEAKRNVLEKQCIRLQRDDNNIIGAITSQKTILSVISFGVGVGSLVLFWQHKQIIWGFLLSLVKPKSTNQDFDEQIRLAREARLRRFSENVEAKKDL